MIVGDGVDLGVEVEDDLRLGVVVLLTEVVGVMEVALAVGFGVLVAAFFALGVADGLAVGVSSIGVGVIKNTSNEGVGGIGEINFCCDLTKK